MLIREERADDRLQVEDIHRRAFGDRGRSVVALVDDLRASLGSEQGLSLVASDGERLLGHVCFTRSLLDTHSRLVDVQVLSPVGVLPERQRQGVGSALIRYGLSELDQRDVPMVFLEGSPAYYPRFGFLAGDDHHFRRPSLRIPKAAFQVHMLKAFEPWMTGTLVYRQTFWDHDAVGLRDAE